MEQVPQNQAIDLKHAENSVAQNAVQAKVVPTKNERDLAAVSYLLLFSLIIYALRRSSPFIRFHAKQGVALFILAVCFWFIPYAGKLLELLVLAGVVWGFLAAANGEWLELPVVGLLARGKMLEALKAIPQFFKKVLRAAKELKKKPQVPLAVRSAASILSSDSPSRPS